MVSFFSRHLDIFYVGRRISFHQLIVQRDLRFLSLSLSLPRSLILIEAVTATSISTATTQNTILNTQTSFSLNGTAQATFASRPLDSSNYITTSKAIKMIMIMLMMMMMFSPQPSRPPAHACAVYR